VLDQKSLTLSDKLEAFEKGLGTNDISVAKDSIKECLSLDDGEMSGLKPEELKNVCFTLSNYQLYLSNLFSHHYSMFKGLEAWLSIYLPAESIKVKSYSFEERRAAALGKEENKELLDAYEEKIEHEMKAERVRDLMFKMESHIKRIENYLRR
jgi:hypothetical protein